MKNSINLLRRRPRESFSKVIVVLEGRPRESSSSSSSSSSS